MKSCVLTSTADRKSDSCQVWCGRSSARTRSGGRSQRGSSCAAAYGSSSAGRACLIARALDFELDWSGTGAASASCQM